MDSAIIHPHINAVAPAPSSGDYSTGAATDNKTISAYVNFLQEIEQRRTVLRQSFTSAATSLIGQTPAVGQPTSAPGSVTSTSASAGGQVVIAAYQQQWLDLIRDFNSQQIPKGCEMLSNNYYRVLQDYITLLAQMSSGPHTQEAISSAESANQGKIETDALAADQSLQQVCSSSDIAKSFVVATDVTSAPTNSVAPSAAPTGSTSAPQAFR